MNIILAIEYFIKKRNFEKIWYSQVKCECTIKSSRIQTKLFDIKHHASVIT